MNLTNRMRNSLVVTTLVALLAPGCALAEKLDCSGSKTSKQEVSTQSIKPGDRPDRELVQVVRIDVLSSKNPEFDGTEETVYVHLDHIGGTGTHSGYVVNTTKSGEKLWARFQGAHYFVPKGGDAWELPYVGNYHYIAGTGKYKAIRGGGYYRGMITPAGLTEEFVCEAEY
jgi:hypothetical protein